MSAKRVRPVPAVLVGLLIDLVDLTLAGPLGVAGAVIAAALVWWLAGHEGVRPGPRIALTAATAVYCALPLTELVPLGTLVGAVLSLVASRERRSGNDGDGSSPVV